MDIKEAKALARHAKADIGDILDTLFEKTGISITAVVVRAIETTSFNSTSREFRHHVTLSASMDF